VSTLAGFKHVEQPKDWNLPALTALFDLLGLVPGMVQLATQGKEEPIVEMQQRVERMILDLVLAHQRLSEGLVFWGFPLLSEDEQASHAGRFGAFKALHRVAARVQHAGKLKISNIARRR